jgi:hypothetical protein
VALAGEVDEGLLGGPGEDLDGDLADVVGVDVVLHRALVGIHPLLDGLRERDGAEVPFAERTRHGRVVAAFPGQFLAGVAQRTVVDALEAVPEDRDPDRVRNNEAAIGRVAVVNRDAREGAEHDLRSVVQLREGRPEHPGRTSGVLSILHPSRGSDAAS